MVRQKPSTKQVIDSMLKENTGRNLVDSGGYGGRHWQRNQSKNFESEPHATVDFRHGFVNVSKSLYHYMNDHFEYDHIATHAYNVMVRWIDSNCKRNKIKYMTHYEMEPMFPSFLAYYLYNKQTGNKLDIKPNFSKKIFDVDLPEDYEATGLYGTEHCDAGYTYNDEINNLSQDFQYYCFTIDDVDYIVIQVHGGTDARWGFTEPKVFRIKTDEYSFLRDIYDSVISCENDHRWYYDYDRFVNDESDFGLDKFKCLDDEKTDGKFEEGKVCYYSKDHQDDGFIPTGTGLCPCCGSVLTAY